VSMAFITVILMQTVSTLWAHINASAKMVSSVMEQNVKVRGLLILLVSV
jgi:hypothetical protein